MGLPHGILWAFGILLVFNSELTLAQNKRSSSRITSSRSFGTNIKGSSSSQSSLAGVNFDCPEEFGYYPHPNDCTQYYVCVFGGALLESCTGGLMYSHELQTCDWPRNVGCDLSDSGASVPVSSGGSSSYRDGTQQRVSQNKQPQLQQQPQHVPHRVRFGSAFSSSTQAPQSKPTIVQQYQPRQQQVIQAQVQSLPPPPELRVAPNPVITSRGQPKPLLDSNEDIAKLYADAHDTLPPVEEEENDRQQRVYRGQPSTVGQVQRDRDGIIHQASINSIPNHGKIGSYAYGAQINQYRRDDVDTNSIDLHRQRREVQNVTTDTVEPERQSLTFTNQTEDIIEYATTTEESSTNTDNTNDDDTTEPDDTEPDESVRSTRQLRPLSFNTRLNRWQLTSSNYRAVDSNPYQQQSFSFGAFNPYLTPPLNPHLKDLKGNPLSAHLKPKPHYNSLGYSITTSTQSPLGAYKPYPGYYATSTSRPSILQQSDILPFLLQSLKEIQQQKKQKLAETENFSYFHLENEPVKPTKSISNTHYSQFSTVGGFFNNYDNQADSGFKPTPGYQPSKLISQYSIATAPVETTTESNYFQYNILQNQKMKNFFTTPTTTTAPPPSTSNFQIVSAPNLSSGSPPSKTLSTLNIPSAKTHKFSFENLTTTPLPATQPQKVSSYVKPGTLSSNFNIGHIMSGVQYSNMEHMQPAIMDMIKYFRQTAGPAGHRGKATKAPSTTTTNADYEYYDEEDDLKTKKPTVNTKAPKGYESFIKSIPNQANKSQTKLTLKNVKNATTRPLKSTDDYYYDEEDDYNIRHPPSEKPPYMPNSETMPPRPPASSTPKYKRPNSVTGFLDVTTRRPIFSSHFKHDSAIPSFINFPSDIFQDLRNQQNPKTGLSTNNPFHRPTTSPSTTTTVTTTKRPYTSTTTRKVYTVRPNRGHSKWKYNKASEATKTDHRKRPTDGQRPQSEQDEPNRVESSSQAPPPPPPQQPSANIFISQQRPKIVETNSNGNRNYYNTSYETQQQQSYDPYYSVYDDDIDLYRDVEYSNQQQQQQQHQLRSKVPQQQHQQVEPQRPTYRPEIIPSQPSPQQVPAREAYISKPIQKQQESKPYNNQQSLIYNTDYDEDLIAQIEQDNEYDQPTRAPIRDDRFAINSISDRPIVVSSTVDIDDEPFYASLSSTLAPPTDSLEEQEDPFDIPFLPRNPSPAPTSTFRPKVVETVPADEYSIFPNNQQPATTVTSITKSSTSATTPSTTTKATTTSTTSSTTTTTTTTQTPPHYDTTQSTTTTKRSNRLRDDSVKSTTIKATPKSVILTFTSNVGLHNQSHKHKTNTDTVLSQSPSETTPSVQVVSPSELKRENFEEAESVDNKVSSKQARLNSTKSRVSRPVEIQNDNNNQKEEDQKEKVVTERQRNRILSYIVSDVEPESFKPQSARASNGTSTTTTTATTTTTNKPIEIPLDGGKQKAYRFSLSQGFRGFSFKAEETRPELKLVTESEEESHSAEVPIYTRSRSVSHQKEVELGDKEEETPPTTYTPIHSWRFSRTSPLPFGKHDSNTLNGDDSDDSRGLDTVAVTAKENPSEDYVSSAGSERSVVTHQSTTEQTQSFTARASLFKDNLSRTYETTGPTKFVSPYKSLETILQEKEDSLKFNSIRSTPIPRTSSSTGAYQAVTQKPFRSYFIITSPPRILNNTSPSTTVRPGQTTSFVWPSSSLPKTTSSTSTTTTTTSTTPEPTTTTSTTTTTTSTTTKTTTTPEPEILPPSTAAPTTTIRLPSSSFRSKMRQEVSNFNSQARPRGRSRYTASFSNSVDEEPTTYSPKFRFAAAHYESTSYGPETTLSRRRPRPTVARQPKSTTPSERELFQKARKQILDLENESYDKPRSEALIGPPVNKNENTYTDKPPRFTAPTPMTTTERVVEITDRPVQFYSKYRAASTPERTLAESLKNAGYLTNSRGKYRDLGFEDEVRANVQEITESPTSTTTTTSPAPTPTTIPIQSTTPLPARTTTTTPKPTTSTTLATTTTTTSIPSTTSASTKGVIPPRASRVNTAIKTSIAAASNRNKPLATSTFSKCADSTPNAKCNEIPSRTNSNNRNRGGSAYSNGAEREQPATVSNHRGTHPPKILFPKANSGSRTRPTLKPSQTIVSKAQEFVDIYRNPPSRPEPLYPQPTPDKTAAKCRKDVCLLPDCYCGGKEIPADLPVESVPQIVLLTFDDSVNDLNKQLYTDLFEKGRVNPNGCPISATFYVSHEWTDYSQVQNLYSDGHEIASHTVSHSFGEQFSQKKWTREVAGQREILAAYGGVKLSDVRGMRAPFLSVGGNKMYKMLYDSNFTYDSSMPVYENRPPSWPYTLDYKIFHDCMIPPCPTKSYPGVWQVPMVMWQDLNGGRCSMGDACSNPGDAEGVYKMIMKNFERHYTTNRAPFGLFYHAAWFTQPHHKEGFIKFLDAINSMQDVWILTNWQALQWVRDPTPTSRLNSFQPFQCDYSDRPKRCNNPKVCNLWHKSGVRYMRTCQPCPDIYPWTGKTGIRSSRVDNDIEES